MSVVINAQQVNLLIFKYLLEQGMDHSAFSLFHESKLQEVVEQYDKDIKAGQLLHYLERALVLNQIESHIDMSQYVECVEDFELIKPHSCTVVERRKMQKSKDKQSQQEAQTQILEKYAATNIYVKENKKVQKQTLSIQNQKNIKLSSNQCLKSNYQKEKQQLVIYDDKLKCLLFWQESTEGEFGINSVAPVLQDQFDYMDGVIEIMSNKQETICWLNRNHLAIYDNNGILNKAVLVQIDQNSNIKQTENQGSLVALLDDQQQLQIINIESENVLFQDPKINTFAFRTQKQFYFIRDGKIEMIDFDVLIMEDAYGYQQNINIQEIIQLKGFEAEDMKWNKNLTLLALMSKKSNQIRIYLANQQEHLMVLSDSEYLQNFQWGGTPIEENIIISNFIVAWGDDFIKVWDIEVGEVKFREQIGKFEVGDESQHIKQVVLMGTDIGNLNILVLKQNGDLECFNLKTKSKIQSAIKTCQHIQSHSESKFGVLQGDNYYICDLEKMGIF